MNIGFAGTDAFSLSVLELFSKGLCREIKLELILTQPPKKKGRGFNT